MAVEKYQFLDEVGVQALSNNLLGKVNFRIDERIVTDLNASSDDNHVLSAKQLYTLLGGASDGASNGYLANEKGLVLDSTGTPVTGTDGDGTYYVKQLDDGTLVKADENGVARDPAETVATNDPVMATAQALAGGLQGMIDALDQKLDQTNYQHGVDVAALTSNLADEVTNRGTAVADEAAAREAADTALGGRIDDLATEVSGLTHLTIDTVEGAIEDVANPRDDVLYFQKDSPNWPMDGYGVILADDGSRATANDGTIDYYGVWEDGKVYKCTLDSQDMPVKVAGDIELADDDALFTNSTKVEDKTWELYVYRRISEGVYKWVNIGDTSIDLDNYWRKDAIEEMRVALRLHDVEALTAAQISAKVDAAFAETTPYEGAATETE